MGIETFEENGSNERERIFCSNYFDFIEWSGQLSGPNPKCALFLSLCGDICFSWQLAPNSQQPMRLYYAYTLTYTIFKISSSIQNKIKLFLFTNFQFIKIKIRIKVKKNTFKDKYLLYYE